jgi:hypothetical protein
MPNSLPGVKITKKDLSYISNLNVSLIGAAIGEFKYGDDEEVMNIYSVEDFILNCGDIDDAPNKQSWMAIYKALEDIEAMKILNITKNAYYGGVLMTNRGMKQFPVGITTRDKDSFNFKFLISNEVLETSDGSTATFESQLEHPVVSDDYDVTLKFYIDDELVSVTGTQLENGTVVFEDDNITSGILTNRTGILNITFTNVPDSDTDITITYRKDYNDYIVDELLAVGDGSSLVFDEIVVNNTPISDYSCKLKYIISGLEVEVTGVASNGTITFTDATNLDSATLDQTTGIMSLSFKIGMAPDNNTAVSLSYEQIVYPLAALIARSKKTWSDDNGLKITEVDVTTEEIEVEEYQQDSDGIETLKETYIVGLKTESKNTYGKNIFIEEIFKNDSRLFWAIVNTDTAVLDMLPVEDESIVYCNGGVDGDTVTDTERALGITKFNSPEIDFDKWCGAGITSKTLIDDISSLVTSKNVEAYMDTIDGSDTEIVTWMGTTINIDNMDMCFTAPNYYVSYKGAEYVCPVSGLQLDKKARRVKAGQPFMPPTGIGEDKGSLNVIKPIRYFNTTQIRNLHKANVNIGRYFPYYGNVLFSDFTSQKKLSSTSYMNSVETLNNMFKTFDNSLLVINFNVINSETFLLLRTIIESYLRQLQKYDGTIESDTSETPWVLKIEELNDATTKDERKIYAELIFTFQTLAEEVNLQLTYTSNQVYKEIAK